MDSSLQLLLMLGSLSLGLVLLVSLLVMPYRLWQRKKRNELRDELEAMGDELGLWRANRRDETR
ncbi:hypothetical protein [Rothia sp. ZJ932]|uniref:hypothetical protein n=1 Tax=Rothia sp. ZJ932 TaxID=2810516 RepID=UPI0019682878|nr:hypothetical protein [Rothia sp. ZJ932]QRZ61542.1 hypothetical protein JR346_10100 [Rothia sp. ZJ932]